MINKTVSALTGTYRSVFLLSICGALNSFGMGTIGPVLPLFVQHEYQVNATQVGVAIGLFGAGRLFTGVPAGYLSQRYGRKPIIVLGAAVNLLGATMVSMSFHFWWLTGWRFVSGLGGNVFSTVITVYLRDESTRATRGRILSTQELAILSGQILGPLLGGYLGSVFGLRVPLFTQAALMAISLALIVTALPESRWRERQGEQPGSPEGASGSREPRATGNRSAFLSLVLSPAFIFVGLFAIMIVANRQGARFSVMPLFGAIKGFGPGQLGLWLSVTHLPQFFATMVSGYLSDRFGRKSPVIPSAILMCAGIATFIWAGELWQLLLSGVLMGIGEGMGSPAGTVFYADIAPPGMEGITLGIFRSFAGIGTVAGAMVFGAIADVAGFPWALWTDAILFGAAAIGVVLFVRDTRRNRPD
ncbi:MAG: MFS transporter [Dehalococcoidia bacterium]|nr:MFS transporter [Dehalococcoidia bacterium]